MHDIGKVTIPDAILQKAGKLTTEEYKIMKTHAEKGSEIIKSTFGSVGDEEYEKIAYEVAYYHHEKWNGSGYPTGKKQTKYHFVQELWQLQMYLMHYLPADVIKNQCH